MVTFRHRSAVLGWAFAAAFLLVCALFTYLALRDGVARIPVGGSMRSGFHAPWVMPVVLAVFWIAGLGLAAHVAARPCTTIDVLPDGTVEVVDRFPWRRTVRRFGVATLSPAEVVATTDDEGDPFYETRFGIPDGGTVCLARGA